MNSYLQYYPNKIFNDFDISNYEPFMLTKDFRKEHNEIVMKEEKIEEKEKEKEKGEEKPRNRFILPKQCDTLFWCLYIIGNGMGEYNEIGHNYGVKELEEKQKMATFVKNNITKIKNTNYKITNVAIQEILSELMTVQKKTSMLILLVMIVFYNVNIILVNENKKNNTMIEFWCNKEEGIENSETYVLYKDDYGKYRLQIENISLTRLNEMRGQMYTLEKYDKSLKPVASYKTEELIEIARKLNCYDEAKKYKKVELYQHIQDEISGQN